MTVATNWTPVGPDLESIFAKYDDPLGALSRAEIPAVILRQAYDPSHCQALVTRFIDRGLIRDPEVEAGEDAPKRIDIGTSLGTKGNDKEDFLQHSQETHALFAQLFEGYDDPVKTLYDCLSRLAVGKEVMVAREPDGRQYGPAIFRTHYIQHAYSPHIDHVTLREKRFNYEVTRFEDQFAGVLCVQNSTHEGRSGQSVLHRCLWTEEVQPHIAAGTFYEYAEANGVEKYQVDLEQGDLYFFNTRCIHEVPALEGNDPRIVLAVFIGYSADDEQIYVWS